MNQSNLPIEDIYLAATIATLFSREPDYQVENSQVTFLFPAGLDLSRAIARYYNDGVVPAKSYAYWLTRLINEKTLRAELAH